jgi:hypothetical protein
MTKKLLCFCLFSSALSKLLFALHKNALLHQFLLEGKLTLTY